MEDTGHREEAPEEALEALTAMFPEIQIRKNKLKLCVDLRPERPVEFVLVDENGKESSRFESRNVGGFEMVFSLPLQHDGFALLSNTVSTETLSRLSKEIKELINEAYEQGFGDSAALSVCNFLAVEVPAEKETELLENYCLRTNDEKRFQAWSRLCEETRLRHFTERRFSCPICLENKDGSEGVLLDCEHSLCKNCFKEYATTTIDAGDVTKLQCPECPIEIVKHIDELSAEQLKAYLFKNKMPSHILRQAVGENGDGDAYVKKYEELLSTILFETYSKHYPLLCSNCPRCRVWSFKDDADEQLVICRRCSLAYCFECKHSWHGYNNRCGEQLNKIPADVVEKMLDDDFPQKQKDRFMMRYGRASMKLAIDAELSDREFLETVRNDDTLIRCPRCETVITKSDGCNKMDCSVCHQNFCYLCGGSLPRVDPYSHYNIQGTWCYRRLFEGLIADGQQPDGFNGAFAGQVAGWDIERGNELNV